MEFPFNVTFSFSTSTTIVISLRDLPLYFGFYSRKATSFCLVISSTFSVSFTTNLISDSKPSHCRLSLPISYSSSISRDSSSISSTSSLSWAIWSLSSLILSWSFSYEKSFVGMGDIESSFATSSLLRPKGDCYEADAFLFSLLY